VNPGLLQIGDEPTWIAEPALFAMHAQQIERYGGLHGILDGNVVRSALAKPINKWAHDRRCDMADLAAAYLMGFAGSQAFNDGSKRTGVACALVFLAINGISVDNVSPDALEELTVRVATNEADAEEAAKFFRSQLIAT